MLFSKPTGMGRKRVKSLGRTILGYLTGTLLSGQKSHAFLKAMKGIHEKKKGFSKGNGLNKIKMYFQESNRRVLIESP